MDNVVFLAAVAMMCGTAVYIVRAMERYCRELESIVMAIRNYIDQHGEQEFPVDAVSV